MTVAQEFVKVSMIAKDEVKKLIAAENNPEIGLRLGVRAAGVLVCLTTSRLLQRKREIPSLNMKASRFSWMQKASFT